MISKHYLWDKEVIQRDLNFEDSKVKETNVTQYIYKYKDQCEEDTYKIYEYTSRIMKNKREKEKEILSLKSQIQKRTCVKT